MIPCLLWRFSLVYASILCFLKKDTYIVRRRCKEVGLLVVVVFLDVESNWWDIQVPNSRRKKTYRFIFQLPKTLFFLGHFSTLRRTGRVSMGFCTTLLGRIFRNTTTLHSFRMRKCLLMRCSRFTVHSRFNVPNHWWLEDACHVSDQLLLVFMILQSLWSQEKCSFELCCDLDLRLPRQLLLSEAVDRLKEAPVGGRWNLDLQLCERKMGQVLQVWHLSFLHVCAIWLISKWFFQLTVTFWSEHLVNAEMTPREGNFLSNNLSINEDCLEDPL